MSLSITTRIMMNSIAVWWEKTKEDLSAIELHLDINLWRSNDSDNNSIEFGIKITGSNEEKFYIDFPFKFDKCQFHDLIPHLSKNAEFSKILFNENISLETSDTKFTVVKFNGTGVRYTLLSDDEFQITPYSNGRTRLLICLPKPPCDDFPLYFRFTIDLTESIYETKNENYFYIDGIYRKVALLDLNINCLRKLPVDIAGKLNGIQIKSINMFLITGNIISFDFVSKAASKSRILERDVWSRYRQLPYEKAIFGCEKNKIKNTLEGKEVLAFHWKEIGTTDKPIEEYSLFAKFSFSRKKWKALTAFVLVIVILGGIGGVLGNFATTKLFNGFADENQTAEQKKG